MQRLIVCGRYTPDYAPWVVPLRARLDVLRVPHDFVETDRSGDGREACALTKPQHIRNAMDRHPGRIILFLDVDCEIVGGHHDLARLADIDGDVAFYACTGLRRNGEPIFAPRSRSILLRPTMKARVYVNEWIEACEQAPRSAVHHDTMTVALGRVPELSITLLGLEFCATDRDNYPLPVILCERARTDARKPGRLASLVGLAMRP